MAFPKEVKERLLNRFDNLIHEADSLSVQMKANHSIYLEEMEREASRTGIYAVGAGEVHRRGTELASLKFRIESSIRQLFDGTERLKPLLEKVEKVNSSHDLQVVQGLLIGLKDDLENGMLISLSQHIESNIASDYMQQAEDLLGEGISGKYDHVPAAVLSGAVLEKSLRELCSRQNPPIELFGTNGGPKTLDPLITDLQKANVFSKAKADQLKSWTKIRNDAAHGEFTTFSRQDVEDMISSIKRFLADHL